MFFDSGRRARHKVEHERCKVWVEPKPTQIKYNGREFISYIKVAGDDHLILNGLIRPEIIIDVFLPSELHVFCMDLQSLMVGVGRLQ